MSYTFLSTLPLVLASQSLARLRLLRAANLKVEVKPAYVDETSLKRSLQTQNASPPQGAETLADAKGIKVSRANPSDLVIAADQLLVCGSVWFDKPGDLDQAFAQLMALRGKTHQLWTSAGLWRDGQRLWHFTARSDLEMWDLSEADIEAYLLEAGEDILNSAGAYQFEGLGLRLFSRVQGDCFAIQGLPLLELLQVLRRQESS